MNWKKFVAMNILFGLLVTKVNLGLENWQLGLLGVAIGLLALEK